MSDVIESSWYSVPAYQVENPAVWKQVETILDKSCEEFKTNDVRLALYKGEQQLWVAAPDDKIISVLLTQIHRTKRGEVMTVLFCGGEQMNLWIDERWRLIDFARKQGCIAVRMEGRVGWRRLFPEAEQIGVKLEIKL